MSFLDKWLLSDFNALIKIVDSSLEKYDLQTPTREISSFVDKLSNWYVRRSRERFWGSEMSEDKISAYKTLYEVLVGLSKLIAPFVPFMAETIYQNLVRSLDKHAPKSVHFCTYPVSDEKYIDSKLNEGMDKVLEIVELGRICRSTSGVKNRQPLSKVIICVTEELKLNGELCSLVKDELNVEEIEILHNSDEYVTYSLKPQLKTLGPKYGKLLGGIRAYLESANAGEIVAKVRDGGSVNFEVDGNEVSICKDDLLINLQNKEGFSSATNGKMTVVLDTTLTKELLDKGLVSEFISKVQNLRKDSGLEVTNHISLQISGDKDMIATIFESREQIMKTTLADEFVEGEDGQFETTLSVNGKEIKIRLKKVN